MTRGGTPAGGHAFASPREIPDTHRKTVIVQKLKVDEEGAALFASLIQIVTDAELKSDLSEAHATLQRAPRPWIADW